MSQHHPSFVKPEGHTKIWRYMDFIQFVSLLERRALFFSTINVLRLDDPHEGTYNSQTLKNSSQTKFFLENIGSTLLQTFGRHLAINCWHMNEIESVAMWKVYLNEKHGIAIQSTFQDLKENLKPSDNISSIDVGQIHYLDESDVIPEPKGFNALNSVMWKWKSYEYERELRAVAISNPESLHKYNGLYISIDLDKLIHKIIISPATPIWFSELVKSIASKSNLGHKVESSRLDVSPTTVNNNHFTIDWTCPKCNFSQETVIEPFIVKEYLNDHTTVFTADRVQCRCRKCEGLCAIPIRPEMEYKD